MRWLSALIVAASVLVPSGVAGASAADKAPTADGHDTPSDPGETVSSAAPQQPGDGAGPTHGADVTDGPSASVDAKTTDSTKAPTSEPRSTAADSTPSSTVPATPGATDKTEVTTSTRTAPSMAHGERAWLSVVWEADKKIDDFAMTVTAPAGYTVAYPGGRAASSLYGSSSLARNVPDFAAFSLSVPYTADASVTLQVHATWTRANDHKVGQVDTTLTVPLTTYTGPPFTMTTTSVSTGRTSPTWARLSFTGAAPSIEDVHVTLSGPPELSIVYPNDATSSGLNDSSTLRARTTDYAGVRLDASALRPGTYPLTVTVSYRDAGSKTWTGSVSLVVS